MDMGNIKQLVSIVGAALILIPFAALSFKKMDSKDASYNLMNFAGGLILTITAIIDRNIGFIILELVWASISLMGFIKTIKPKKQNSVQN